jgi:hypothetical protein
MVDTSFWARVDTFISDYKYRGGVETVDTLEILENLET